MIDIYTGIDIVENSRIKKVYEKFGDRFLKKVYFSSEIQYCKEKVNKYECLAGRFAAKEAVIKVIHSAFGINLSFREIEVLGRKNKPAEILLHLKPENRFILSKPFKIRLSLSHEKNYSVAVAIILLY